MREHTITSEPGDFSDKLKEKERRRAIVALISADSFLVITKKGSGNDCISAIEGEHTEIMAFNCHLAEQKLISVLKKEYENGDTTGSGETGK
jgi:hypothetical protein